MANGLSRDEVLKLMRSFQPACVLAAAAELDIFTSLATSPANSSDLSARLGTYLRDTTILLDALASLGFLIKENDKYHVPPVVAEMLSEASPTNILPGVRHQANGVRRWAQLARVIQTGGPAECPPSIRGEQADLASFIGAMENYSAPVAEQVIDKLQPLRFRHLLDIGAGPGTWTIALLLAVPNTIATVFDLPDVIPMARQRIEQAGLTKRVTFVAGDYLSDELPKGADFAWLSAIAHQNSREQNAALFAKIHRALSDGGILAVRDVVMDESRTSPQAGALFAINMLVATEHGNTYTFEEFRSDLSLAGFTNIELLYHDDAMNSLIRAEKHRA